MEQNLSPEMANYFEESIFPLIREITNDIIAIIRPIATYISNIIKHLKELFDHLLIQLEMIEPLPQKDSLPREFLNPPNDLKHFKIFENGFFTKPLTREEFWALFAHTIEVFGILSWLFNLFKN